MTAFKNTTSQVLQFARPGAPQLRRREASAQEIRDVSKRLRQALTAGRDDEGKRRLSRSSKGAGRLLEFQPSRVKVGDQITVEIRLTVTNITRHPDRAFVIGEADDGSMVTFDEDAPRGIFWNWD